MNRRPAAMVGLGKRTSGGRSQFLDGVGHGFATWYVTNLQRATSRILDAEGAGSGVTDLQGRGGFGL